MLGFDLFLWIPIGLGVAGWLVKTFAPKKVQDKVAELEPLFDLLWTATEALGQKNGWDGVRKGQEFVDELHSTLLARGVQPKNWMRTAAENYARLKSAAAKLK